MVGVLSNIGIWRRETRDKLFRRVLDIREVRRWQLFPDEPHDEKSNRRYYQVFVKSVQTLPKPIFSRRFRRIIFIPTTWEKFINASEINDLFDESSLEDKLWAEFKRHNIPAERQEYVIARKNDYALDFAVYCAKGNIDIETDGDFWHANPEKAEQDNLRDHDLSTEGWKILRFSENQIQEQAASYCVKTVSDNINLLGGVDEGKVIPRKINLDSGSYQPSLFDGLKKKSRRVLRSKACQHSVHLTLGILRTSQAFFTPLPFSGWTASPSPPQRRYRLLAVSSLWDAIWEINF
ncbi:MAG: endonuclease domain-containing protein [Anaerolineales bacterium]|nr:endonuclease domain-containing protein [Anaerolineales bacterium]